MHLRHPNSSWELGGLGVRKTTQIYGKVTDLWESHRFLGKPQISGLTHPSNAPWASSKLLRYSCFSPAPPHSPIPFLVSPWGSAPVPSLGWFHHHPEQPQKRLFLSFHPCPKDSESLNSQQCVTADWGHWNFCSSAF